MLIVPILLACAVACSGRSNAVTGDVAAACKDAPLSLCARMEHLEGQVIGQMQRDREQVSSLEQKLLSQESQLNEQGATIRQLATDLSEQRVTNRQQATEMSQQGVMIRQLATKLSEQGVLVRQQTTELSEQRQPKRLARQERRIQRLTEAVRALQDKGGAHGPSDLRKQEVRAAKAAGAGSEDSQNSTSRQQQSAALAPSTLSSESHDRLRRSDETDPLEDVVHQVSQKVTVMSADLQAFKTQASVQLQSLKTQTGVDIQALQTSLLQQGQTAADARSSSYIHWGSAACGNPSRVVYTGVVGGGYHGDTGAATNYLCLSMSPVVSGRDLPGGTSDQYATLYGAEYLTYDSHMNKVPVCAVCQSRRSVMIPGTNVCTPGWYVEYSGYLMAGVYGGRVGSEYICVDSRFESHAGSTSGELHYDKQLSFVVARCGNLPCGPYVANKVVTCVVCSQ